MAQRLILSIDGGGTRGIIPATILDLLFKDIAAIRPAIKTPTDFFDLFAGTSTGGIICIGLTHGLAPADLVDLYLNKAKTIFHDTGWDDLRDGFGKNIGADYSNKRFGKILTDLFGKATLADIHARLGDNKQLMVCSFDINPTDSKNKDINFRPTVFNSGFLGDAAETLVDLALRTSAGPTYFPIYQQKYIDGGVAMNHPAMAAVAFAINSQKSKTPTYLRPNGFNKGLGLEPKDLKVLSLGCGTSNKNNIPKSKVKDGDWGNMQWVKYLPDLLTEANVQASEYYVQQVLPEDNYMRIQLEFDAPDAPPILQGKTLGLDVKSKKLLEAMHSFAGTVYQKNKVKLLDFLGV